MYLEWNSTMTTIDGLVNSEKPKQPTGKADLRNMREFARQHSERVELEPHRVTLGLLTPEITVQQLDEMATACRNRALTLLRKAADYERIANHIRKGPSGHSDIEYGIRLSRDEAIELTAPILALVEKHFHVTLEQIMSHNRANRPTMARAVAVWLIRQEYNLSYPTIGLVLKRDHSTAIHLHAIVLKRATNLAFQRYLLKLQTELREGLK